MEWHNNQANLRPQIRPVAASAQPPKRPLSYSSLTDQQTCFPSPMQEMGPNPPAAGAHTNSWNQSSILGGSYGQPTNFTGTAGWVSSNVGLAGLDRQLNGAVSSNRMAGNETAQNHGSVGMAAPVTTNPLEVNASTGLRRSRQVYEHSQDDLRCKRRKTQSCSCKKTKCLTLHCRCYGVSEYCGDICGCKDCHNDLQHEVQAARDGLLSRDSDGFWPDQITDSPAEQWKGCKCTLCRCDQQRCGCYQREVRCSTQCWCRGCLNPFGVE